MALLHLVAHMWWFPELWSHKYGCSAWGCLRVRKRMSWACILPLPAQNVYLVILPDWDKLFCGRP